MLNLKTFFFFILSIFGICLSTYLYESYGVVEIIDQKKKKIGYIKDTQNSVYRKFSNKYIWLESQSGQSLYESQAIKTESNSSTIVVLNDGSTIDLKENSLIVLDLESNQLNLNALEGDFIVKVKENSGLKLKNGEKTINLTKESTLRLSSKNKQSEIQILEGSVSIDNKTINSGNTIESNNQKIEIKENVFSNFYPSEKEIFKSIGYKKVKLSWKKNNKNKTTLMIGNSPDRLESFEVNQNYVYKNLNSNTYYWKVKDSNEESPLFSFSISEVERNYPIFPSKDYILFESPTIVNFKFQESNDLKIEEIQLSKDINFANLIDPRKELKTGTYFWRLKEKFENQDYFSESISFRVEPKPVSIEIKDLTQIPDFYLDNPKIQLKWESTYQGSVAKWIIRVDTKNQLKEFESLTTSVDLVDIGENLEVYIRGFDKYGNLLGENHSKYKLTKAPEAIYPIIPNYESDSLGNFKISYKNQYKKCQIIVENKKGFEKKINCEDSISNLYPGVYEIKAVVEDQYGRKLMSRIPSSLIVPEESSIKAPTKRKVKVQ